MAAINEGRGAITAGEIRTFGEVRNKSLTYFGPGDVLFAKITPSMENGKAAVVPDIESGLGFGSTEFHVLRPRSGTNPRYIWHYIRRRSFRRAAERHMSGSVGQLRVPAAFLEASPIYMPSQRVQDKLVDLLDSVTDLAAGCGAHITNAIGAVERLREAILAAACSGHLTADWREANTDSTAQPLIEQLLEMRRDVGSGRARTPVPVAESDLPPIPKSWRWASLDSLTRAIVDGVHKTPIYVSGGIPFLTVRNLTATRGISFEACKYIAPDDHKRFTARTKPERGDLLISKDGTLGVTRAVRTDREFSIFVSLALAKPLLHEMTDYLELALQSPQVQRQMTGVGSGLTHLVLRDLKADGIPLPPLEEQHVIAERVRKLLWSSENLLTRINEAAARIEKGSQTVIERVFSGGIG